MVILGKEFMVAMVTVEVFHNAQLFKLVNVSSEDGLEMVDHLIMTLIVEIP